jgi:hypothetical protein
MTSLQPSHRVERPTAADIRLLHGATLAVLAAAIVGLVPGSVGTAGGVTAVVVAIGAPVLRVGRLAVRWARRGDTRYALSAAALVLVVAGGGVLAVLTGS